MLFRSWMEGGLVSSFEKFMADTEILDLLCQQFRTVEITEDDLAFDAHVEAGHGGHFFGTQHTLERFRDGHLIDEAAAAAVAH